MTSCARIYTDLTLDLTLDSLLLPLMHHLTPPHMTSCTASHHLMHHLTPPHAPPQKRGWNGLYNTCIMTSCARIYTPISLYLKFISLHLKSTTSRTLLPPTPPSCTLIPPTPPLLLPYSPLAPPTKGGQTPPSILLSFTHFKDCHVIFALCYTVYSKDFLFNTLKIAVIKHKVVLKGNYMRLQFVRLQNFL